jgi:hypothetical protein
MTLAEALPTGTFLAVSPFITASIVGSLFAFTVVYSRRAQLQAASLLRALPEAAATGGPHDIGASAPDASEASNTSVASEASVAEATPQIPLS